MSERDAKKGRGNQLSVGSVPVMRPGMLAGSAEWKAWKRATKADPTYRGKTRGDAPLFDGKGAVLTRAKRRELNRLAHWQAKGKEPPPLTPEKAVRREAAIARRRDRARKLKVLKRRIMGQLTHDETTHWVQTGELPKRFKEWEI